MATHFNQSGLLLPNANLTFNPSEPDPRPSEEDRTPAVIPGSLGDVSSNSNILSAMYKTSKDV